MDKRVNIESSPNLDEHFPEEETPKILKASDGQNPVYREVHADGVIMEADSEALNQTRLGILNKYHILENQCIINEAETGSTARKIRAFTILLSKENPGQSWYAEGHIPHAVLLEQIFEKQQGNFSRQNIVLNPLLAEEFWEKWDVLKGFIDPNQNGFRSFPNSRQELEKKYIKEINGLSEVKEQRANDSLPSWFLSGDTRKEKD